VAFKKIIVAAGLFLLAVGVVVSAIPAQETYIETITLEEKTWNLHLLTLAANATIGPYGSYMEPGRSFQLDVSSSDDVRLEVSIMTQQGGSEEPVFAQTGRSFNQKVAASVMATYVIYITNENPVAVTLDGSVFVTEEQTSLRTVYPYLVPGVLVMLGGAISLPVGISKKSEKPPKSKSLSGRKIKG
jgi:hypothetical protein